jgi:hypothetical protein
MSRLISDKYAKRRDGGSESVTNRTSPSRLRRATSPFKGRIWALLLRRAVSAAD